jgi:S1-C subfamily serine protease
LYQISAPVQPGNSGGPLFDGSGNLIGIVSAKHGGAENVGYAIKVSYLINLVESSLPSSIIPFNNSISSRPLTGKVKGVKNHIFMIKCNK